jgi:hypothetical protein
MKQLSEKLSHDWDQILKLDSGLLTDYSAPLAGIDDALLGFGLTPLPEFSFNPPISPEMETAQPSFKYLNEGILLSLRKSLYRQSETETVSLWAEKLMRFCEIRFATLKKRAIEKWTDAQAAQLNMLHLSAFLLDYYRSSKDLRYLNTVLKLADLGWIIDPKSLARNLTKTHDKAITSLFQFRILLLSEYALARLVKGEIQ